MITPNRPRIRDQEWNNHVFQAAKSFLKCAVVIDDRPFRATKPPVTGHVSTSSRSGTTKSDSPIQVDGPIPSSAKTATAKSAMSTQPAAQATSADDATAQSGQSSETHDLDLRALTDSFAEHGIVCGTLIPDNLKVEGATAEYGENILVQRAQNMAQTADILIVDWYLKKQNHDTTIKIIDAILGADEREGGRARLICIYTGEDDLDTIRRIAKDRLATLHKLTPSNTEASIKLTKQSTSIVFLNKKTVEGKYALSERDLPLRLIREFSSLIDGLLPSFAASSIGAIRRNTHAILNIFGSELDPAYVANRAICDPSEKMAEMVRDLLVSEFDNQIGFAKSADKYLAGKAVSLWLDGADRLQQRFKIILAKLIPGKPSKEVKQLLDLELIRRACCGEITTFDKPFDMDGEKYRLNERQRRKFSHALCVSEAAALDIEERFARLASNKREAHGRAVIEQDWRPSLTVGTLIVTSDGDDRAYFMCVTRACDMVRLSNQTKDVVLVKLERCKKRFNLVIPVSEGENVKLFVPRELSNMRKVTFKVNTALERITATKRIVGGVQQFIFDSTSPATEYAYLGELRYLRALRDVESMIRQSTAIGIADSEWLRLSERL